MAVEWALVWFSLRVTGLAWLGSLVAGVALASVLERRSLPAVDAGLTIWLSFPPTIVAGYFFCHFTQRPFTLAIAVVAAAAYGLPVLFNTGRNAFRALDDRYANAARSLGASEWRVFWRVVAPQTYRPIAEGAGIVFARMLTELALVLAIASRLPA